MFMGKNGHRVPSCQQGLRPLSWKCIEDALRKMPSSAAGGVWTPSDLKEIPDSILELLLLLFDLIESTGEWPAALAWAGITPIPKERGANLSA